MRCMSAFWVALLCCLMGARLAWSCGGPYDRCGASQAAPDDRTALCIAALSEDKAEAARAIAALRAMGPSGLASLMQTYQSAIDRHRQNPTKVEPMWDRLSAALDGVAAQKDAWAAGLYWYTDLAAA